VPQAPRALSHIPTTKILTTIPDLPNLERNAPHILTIPEKLQIDLAQADQVKNKADLHRLGRAQMIQHLG
jgi:hypothetical protein